MGRKRDSSKYRINLKPEEREAFLGNQKKGVHSARLLRRERILLLADDGCPLPKIASQAQVSLPTVYNVLKRYVQTGDVDLTDRPRAGRPEKVSGKVKAHIIATACTDAPKGRSRWTLRLLADQVVQLELIDSISKDTVALILKKTN